MLSPTTGSPPEMITWVVLHDHYNHTGQRTTDITQAYWNVLDAQRDVEYNVRELKTAGLRPEWSTTRDMNPLAVGLRECRLISDETGQTTHWFRVMVAKLK
ncbi:hypothetical protein PMIN02_010400 [Paraphaeosphaeria minitans]